MKTKPKKKSAPAKSAAPKPQKAAKKTSVVSVMLGGLPALTDLERSAFQAQFSDEQCDALGAKTKSEAVFKDGLGFASTISGALAKGPRLVRRYGAARLAWLLECLALLDERRAEQASGKGGGAVVLKATAESAMAKAREVHDDLAATLETLIGGHEIDGAALDDARSDASTPAKMVDSLQALAKIGDGWLRRTDGESKALVASVDLTRGDVDLAWATAAALKDATDRATGKRVTGDRDSQPVNRIEGRVLLEMRLAMRLFEKARDANKSVPGLVPGPGTRSVLASHPMKKAPKKDANGATANP
jgi:hypothetical protein